MGDVFRIIFERTHLVRRIISGLVVLFACFLVLKQHGLLVKIGFPNTAVLMDLLKDTNVFITMVLLSFIFGVIVEMIAFFLFARICGAVAAALRYPMRKLERVPRTSRYILYYLYWTFLLPTALFVFLFRALIGKDDYDVPIERILGARARRAFDTLQPSTQAGFRYPIGPNGPHAWLEIKAQVSEDHRRAIDDEEQKIRDILSYFTAILILVAVFLPGLSADLAPKLGIGAGDFSSFTVLTIYLGILPFALVGPVFLVSVNNATVTTLELFAANQSAGAGPAVQSPPVARKYAFMPRVFERAVLLFLVFGLLWNIVKWNFLDLSQYATQMSEAGLLADLLFWWPAVEWPRWFVRHVTYPVYWSGVLAIGFSAILFAGRKTFGGGVRPILTLMLLAFVGYVAARIGWMLVSELWVSLSNAQRAPFYHYAIRSAVAVAGALLLSGWALGRLDLVPWKKVLHAALVLGLAVLFWRLLTLGATVAYDFNLSNLPLESASRRMAFWLGLATGLVILGWNDATHWGSAIRRLLGYAAVLFVAAMFILSLGRALQSVIGASTLAPLRLDISDWLFYAVAVAGLCPFLRPFFRYLLRHRVMEKFAGWRWQALLPLRPGQN